MSINLFITGTDTNIGKTYVSVKILNFYKELGFSTLGLKPIATGSDPKNEDALLLQAASSIQLPYELINPFAFKPPIAPNIAAQLANTELTIDLLNQKMQPALSHPADVRLIEGVGGTHVPLNQHENLSNWAAQHKFKTILVVGLKLGCLNHAILSTHALLADHAHVIGWIGNCIDPDMTFVTENILTLKQQLPVPCLGIVQRPVS